MRKDKEAIRLKVATILAIVMLLPLPGAILVYYLWTCNRAPVLYEVPSQLQEHFVCSRWTCNRVATKARVDLNRVKHWDGSEFFCDRHRPNWADLHPWVTW